MWTIICFLQICYFEKIYFHQIIVVNGNDLFDEQKKTTTAKITKLQLESSITLIGLKERGKQSDRNNNSNMYMIKVYIVERLTHMWRSESSNNYIVLTIISYRLERDVLFQYCFKCTRVGWYVLNLTKQKPLLLIIYFSTNYPERLIHFSFCALIQLCNLYEVKRLAPQDIHSYH